MRLRKLALAVGLAGMLGADVASALGLGEIKLQSNLNEPLDAEIKLLNVKDLTKEEILVGLAGKDDFQRAGVDRIFFLTGMKFEVDISSPNGPVVHVSSRKPVVEPYLNFLLETQWPSGRLLREYTLLMDLPTFTEEGMVPVQGAQTRRPEPTSSANNRRTPPPVTRPTRDASSAPTSPGRSSRPANSNNRNEINQRASTDRQVSVYGPVSGSDTLWEIALQVRPDRAVSVQQTMLAIQRLNPGAFINDNINLLRKGQVLRIPTRNEIQSLNGRQAVAQVAQQNNEWGDSAGRTSGAALDASRRSSRRDAASTEVSGQVVLGAPVETNSSRSGRSSGSAGGNAEVLQNDLAIAQEELDRTTRENSELKDRVTSLEDQIATMESLIEASNSELERLQALSRQANSDSVASATRQTEVPAKESGVSGGPDNIISDATTDTDVAADDKVAAEADIVAVEAKQTEAAKQEKPKKPKPLVRKQPDTFMDTVMNNIAYIGGGLAALLLAGILYWRHRKNREEWDENEFEPLADEGFDLEEQQSGEDAGSDLDLDADDADVADDTPENADAAVGQADIFVAYRQFDKAEKVLENALITEPVHAGALLKLLEVHAENDNTEAFEAVHGRVIDLENEDLTEQANALRASLLNADTNDSAGDEDVDLASLEADLNDFSFDSDETTGAGESAEDNDLESSLELSLDDELSLDNELSLDEDLTLEDELDGESNIDLSDDFSSSTELTADDDNAFDFDLSEVDDVIDSSSATKPTADDSLSAGIEPEPLEQDTDTLDLDLSSIDDAEIDDANQETDSIDLNSAEDELELDLSLDEQDAESPLTEEDEFDNFDFDLGEDESESRDEDLLLSADLGDDDTFTLELDDDTQASDVDLTLDLSDEVDTGDGVLTLNDPSDEPELSLSLDDEQFAEDDFSASDLTIDLDADIDELSTKTEETSADSVASDGLGAESLAVDDGEPVTTATNELNDDEDAEQGVESFGGSFEEALGLSEPDTLEPDTLLELDEPEESADSITDDSELSVDDTLEADTSETGTKAESTDSGSLKPFAGDDSDISLNDELPELNEPDDDLSLGDDDFDFDSEVNEPVDLAALDQEMDEFDLAADLDIDDEGMPLEDADLSELDMSAADDSSSEPGQLASGILDSETQIHEAIADEQDAQVSESNDENTVFEEALSGVPTPDEPLSFDADDVEDDELDAELDFLADTDEVATKLDLARAYIDMGDAEGAKDILDEVITEGNEEQRTEAEELVNRIG